jgi:plastocyanin
MRRGLRLLVLAALAAALLAPAAPAAAGGFCAGYEGERLTTAKGTRVRMSKNCFAPIVLHVRPGETVTFSNEDPEAHTVGGSAGSFGDMHREIAPGESFTHTFAEEGVYPYVCLIHPGMAGAIVVGDAVATEALAPVSAPDGPSSSEDGSSGGTGPAGSVVAAVGVGALLVALVAAVAGVVARRRRAPVPHES